MLSFVLSSQRHPQFPTLKSRLRGGLLQLIDLYARKNLFPMTPNDGRSSSTFVRPDDCSDDASRLFG